MFIFSIDRERTFCYSRENEQMFWEGILMNKKYRIASKFRFTIFLAVLIICIITAVGSLMGYNSADSSSRDLYNQVEVQSGDTLWAIASEYGPADTDVRKIVSDICRVNDISAESLEAGQKLLVPVYEL